MTARGELLSIVRYFTERVRDYPSTPEQIVDAYRDEVIQIMAEGSEDGHRFHITVQSQGSYGVVGVPGKKDNDLVGPPITLTVRAWDLPAALRKAAAQPLAAWTGWLDGEAEDLEQRAGELE